MPSVVLKKALSSSANSLHDDILTPHEKKLLEQSHENERLGLTLTSTELRKKLGL